MTDSSAVDVISHLLGVEKDAAALMSNAQEEADKRIADYKAKAESEFKQRRDEAVSLAEAEYKTQIEDIKKRHDEEIAAYKASIEGLPQNRKAFNALVEQLLEAE